ncbi:MAG: AsmA-like C-terminal region-containing protein [Candidatus Korobacteraceae bacterium]
MEARYQGNVDIGKLSVHAFPGLQVAAEQVVVRRREEPANMPPFISIGKLSLHTGASALLRKAPKLGLVELQGLVINVPPRRDRRPEEDVDARNQKAGDQQDVPPDSGKPKRGVPDVSIVELRADGTILRIHSRKPGKEPMQFDIERLTMHSVGPNQPMRFQARLHNATPPGWIDSHGKFGPWNAEELSLTPVSGSYQFRDADLSVFRGISGMLSSDGAYDGRLERIEVEGWTDTPDFTLGLSGNRVPLRTEFKAVVDGTNGDTYLQPVTAKLGESTFVARGSIANQPGPDGKPTKGKTISLQVSADRARIEDFLRLAIKAEPPLSGTMKMNARLNLPPGKQDVADKLFLKGEFLLASARFADDDVQSKIRTLSLRGRGINKKEEAQAGKERVVSNLQGKFLLENGRMALSGVAFRVPGAVVHVQGQYGLRSENLDFEGELRIDAKVSETVSGIKALLLKPIDPLFRRDGAGAVIPIRIQGPREEPKFGVDIKRALPFARD